MDRITIIALGALFLLGIPALNAQPNEYNFITAGINFRPIIPSNLLQTSTMQVSGTPEEGNEYLRLTVDQKLGYSFGMIVRKNFSQRFAMETGVNFVRRGFVVEVADRELDNVDSLDFGISSYEIPVMALVYIRLGEQFYMNTALGISLDIGARSVANNNVQFDHFTAIRKYNAGIIANVGVEYRSEKSGTFYLGATYHQPTGPVADTKINYFRNSSASDASLETPLNGSYLTLDLRYYFHENIR